VEVLLQLLANRQCHAAVIRKVKATLRTSVYAQMRWAVSALGLDEQFDCSVNPMQMVYKPTGQTVFFFGLDDAGKLKSIKTPFGYIGILWFEELDQYDGPEEIRSVEQSVLRGGSYSFVMKSFNPPKSPRNWTNAYCRERKKGRVVHHSTYLTTPPDWLGERFFMEAEHLKATNEAAYRHEYMGECVGSGAAVFENIREETITDGQITAFDRVCRGIDWGYCPDPFAYNECHYDAARRTLYIFGEITAMRQGNAQTAQAVLARGRQETITADSAEPKSIADFRDAGLPCEGAKKGPGSVTHGMKWLQSLQAIVIDPARCPDTLREFTQYEYERDAGGCLMDGYPDCGNHHIDAVRYAVERISQRAPARIICRKN
jgi:PBSX family phage terminase large subunit